MNCFRFKEDIKQWLYFTEQFLNLVYFLACAHEPLIVMPKARVTLATFHLGGAVVGRKGNVSCCSADEFSLSALTFPFQLNAYSTKPWHLKSSPHLYLAGRPLFRSFRQSYSQKSCLAFLLLLFPSSLKNKVEIGGWNIKVLSDVRFLNVLAFPGGCLCVCTQLYFALKRVGLQVSEARWDRWKPTSAHLFLAPILFKCKW